MRRVLAAAGLISVLLLFCGAGNVNIGMRGGRGPFVAAGSASGVAQWDTVTVMLSSEVFGTGLVDAAIDTFADAGGGATDTARNVIRNDRRLGRTPPYSFRSGNRDSARLYLMGTGKAVSTFAYGTINQADQNGYAHASGTSQLLYSPHSFIVRTSSMAADSAAIRILNLKSAVANRTAELIYIPFQNYIPARATIVSAVVNFAAASGAYYQTPDSLIAVLMSNANDSQWYGAKGISSRPNYAHASWSFQQDTDGGTWSGTQQYAWSPTIANRAKMWDWGDVCDWSGSAKVANGSGYFATNEGFDVKITNCVQAVVNGATNNGIVLFYADFDAADGSLLHHAWDPLANSVKRTPYVFVKYITRRYQKPFGTAELALTIQTDDVNKTINQALASAIGARGGSFTMFGARGQIGDDVKALSITEIKSLHTSGVEFGSHGFRHRTAADWTRVAGMDTVDGVGGAGDTNWAGIKNNLKSSWMYALSDSLGYSLRGDPHWGKVYGSPVGQITPYAQLAAEKIGYVAYRGLGTSQAYDLSRYFAPSTSPSRGDTINLWAPAQYGTHVRNMRLVGPTTGIKRIVGDTTKTTALDTDHLLKVANNWHRLMWQAFGNDSRVVSTFAHDVKDRAVRTGFYDDGMDVDEIAVMGAVADTMGARFMATSDYVRWIIGTAASVDYPYATAKPDTFRQFAVSGIWGKPDGIDNRWIPRVKRTNVNATFDITAPVAPTSLIAYSGDGFATISWTPSASADVSYQKVYRYFDGAAATLIADRVGGTTYTDATVINGSPHNYYVVAVDWAGHASAPSAAVATTPGAILAMQRPLYWTFWNQDPNAAAFASATIDSLAAFDAVVMGPFALEGATAEPAYTAGGNLITKVRAKNADEVLLTYFSDFTIPNDEVYPAGSAIRRIYDYCTANDKFARDYATDIVDGDVYPRRFFNVMDATLPDTIASILADVYSRSGVNAEYTGFFVDDVDTTLSDWMCNSGDCQTLIDYDQDETTFSEDADEQAALKAFHIDFLRAMRREFAQRGMANRLLVPNTTFGRKAVPNLKDREYLALADGMLDEGWNVYGFPGNGTQAGNATTDQAAWTLAFGMKDLLTHAQTSPPLVIWEAKADSSRQFMDEVLAGAHGGWIQSQTTGDFRGRTHVPTMARRLPAPGAATTVTFAAGSPKTLVVASTNYTAKLKLAQATDDSFAVWPYIAYTAAGDTLSRSQYWERIGDNGVPIASTRFQVNADNTEHDNLNRIFFEAAHNSDIDHYNLYRGGSLLATVPYRPGGVVWDDTTANNETTYSYYSTYVDYLGNESDNSNGRSGTPHDITTPPAPSGVVARGGDGFVAVDWDMSSTADFTQYDVYRKKHSATTFALLATRTNKMNSFLNDSTAVAATLYDYYVKQADDDGHTSAASSTVYGGWLAPVAYAPTNLSVNPNTPTFQQAQLAWDEPEDLTNFVRYRVYRDTSLPLTFADRVDSTDAAMWTDTAATYGTKFYYEVRALYSPGGISDPTNTVENTNINTTPPTAPTLQLAAGDGATGVYLNWSDIYGAASYQIWRGDASPSALLTTTTSSEYTDTSAAQNQTYYYGIKAVDGAGLISAMSNALSASWTIPVAGNPTIASTTGGTLQNAESITLTGSGFGTKPANSTGGAGPIKTDSFEVGTEGQRLMNAQPEWVGQLPGLNSAYCTSMDKRMGSRSIYSGPALNINGQPADGTSNFFVTPTENEELYVTYWMKITGFDYSTGDRAGTLKLGRIGKYTGALNSEYDGPGTVVFGSGGVGGILGVNQIFNEGYIALYAGPNAPEIKDTTLSLDLSVNTADGWFRVEQYKKCSSPSGTANGSFWGRAILPGTNSAPPRTHGFFDVITRGTGNTAGINSYLMGLEQYNKGGTWDTFNDDIYIDNTQARVELGNASTFAACTHREIQIPTAWANGSISINVNTGTFTNGPNYWLFVVKSDGTVSAGKSVTISN